MGRIHIAGDVSGNPDEGNYKYMGINMCTDEHLDGVRRRLGVSSLLDLPKNTETRKRIASALRFGGPDSLGICCRIDRNDIVARFRTRRHNKMMASITPFTAFNRTLSGLLRGRVEDFFAGHGCDLGDVRFECDGDLQGFAKDAGLPRAAPGEAHVIADDIAWLNNRGRELPGMVVMDLRRQILGKLGLR